MTDLTPETLSYVEQIVEAWETTACSRETGAKFRAVLDALSTARSEAATWRDAAEGIPAPGPCFHDPGMNWPGQHPRCQLRAGHAGAHEWKAPGVNGGSAVWLEDPAQGDRTEQAEARAVKAEQERDEALDRIAHYHEAASISTASEADLRARIEALANRAQTEAHLSGDTYGAVVDVDELRALLYPTDPTKEN